MNKIEIADLFDHVLPVGLTASRSGHAVWAERTIREEAPRKPIAHLVSARDGDAPTALTDSGAWVDSRASISPDESWVAFVRSPISEKPAASQLCVVPLDGGEVRALVSERGDFSGLTWHPDSQTIAFAFRRADALPKGASAPLSIHVTRSHYKEDGYGFLPQDRNSIYTISLAEAEPSMKALELDNDGRWDDTDPRFSPDGSELAFLSNRRADGDRNPENRDLFVAPAGGGSPRCCTRHEGMMSMPAWAPSGRWIAAIGCLGPPGTPLMRDQMRLLSIDPTGERAERSLSAELDHSLMNLVIDDLWGLDYWAQRPLFVDDGARVLLPISERGTTWLASFDVDPLGSELGEPTPVINDRIVVSFAGGDVLCALTTSATEPGVIVRLRANGEAREHVASPFLPYLADKRVAEPIELTFTPKDGVEIQAWMYMPDGPGEHPMLLNIHGGPVVQFGTGYFHEVQAFVAAGFAVLQVNPRGSQGYGIDFASCIARDWGRKPHIDLSAAVDEAIARFPIDATRLGVMGGSYGGYMTNWMIAHTDRFKAACTQRTVSQMEALIWSDYGWAWGHEIGSWPWEDREHYTDQSPITYADKIDTPLLILQGLGDQRTPPDQGERLFVTLRVLGKDVEMVLFPGADHNLSRGGQPAQRVERLRVVRDWFAKRLQ